MGVYLQVVQYGRGKIAAQGVPDWDRAEDAWRRGRLLKVARNGMVCFEPHMAHEATREVQRFHVVWLPNPLVQHDSICRGLDQHAAACEGGDTPHDLQHEELVKSGHLHELDEDAVGGTSREVMRQTATVPQCQALIWINLRRRQGWVYHEDHCARIARKGGRQPDVDGIDLPRDGPQRHDTHLMGNQHDARALTQPRNLATLSDLQAPQCDAPPAAGTRTMRGPSG